MAEIGAVAMMVGAARSPTRVPRSRACSGAGLHGRETRRAGAIGATARQAGRQVAHATHPRPPAARAAWGGVYALEGIAATMRAACTQAAVRGRSRSRAMAGSFGFGAGFHFARSASVAYHTRECMPGELSEIT